MAFDKTKFLKRFVEEAKEHVQSINNGLLVLEKTPDDSETLNDIFRAAHTVKGSSKIMKISTVAELAHRLEDALDALRRGSIQFSEGLAEVFFNSIDTISGMLDEVSAGKELPELPEKLCQELEDAAKGKLIDNKQAVVTSPVQRTEKENATPETDIVEPAIQSDAETVNDDKLKQDETVRISGEKLDELIKLMGEIVSGHARLKMRMIELGKIDKSSKELETRTGFLDAGSDRKKGYLLNSVKDLSYEITKFYSGINNDIIIIEGLTDELQESSLKMRMFPVSTIFDSYPRMVRDQAKAAGKKISFNSLGIDTELDKKILEKISDPLLHMIRNSIDHGIETPDTRVEKGKSPTGILELTAEYEGGNVLIKLIDDGAGISLKKIKDKAVSKKIYSEEELEKFSEKQLIDLIFHPGFSTSEMITDISGRGVGMDVVQKNIVRDLSGSIRVLSKENRGTTIEIRLPLTLAVMHMMVVDVAEMIFAIPSTNVDEVLRIKQSELIDVVDKKAIKLREQIIPVVKLQDVLGISTWKPDQDEPLVLIVSVGNEKMGFIINGLLREESRTIKPLPPHLKNNPFVSGVTISGNRMLDNVLNIPKIMEFAKNVKRMSPVILSEEESSKDINILVVDDSVSTREIEKSILESYGYNVNLAGDGIEALENADEFQYDLIITDIEMPRMDGLALTKQLKNRANYKDIPVILISSRDKDEDKRKGLSVGADAYIVKDDFDQGNLIEVIQNLVGA